MKRMLILSALSALLLPQITMADVPQVIAAETSQNSGTARISVTVQHADTGWEHYADGWSVRLADGTEIGYRKLHHPHVEEQPFTRSLNNVTIPEGTETLFIFAHDNVDGWGPAFELNLEE